MTFAVVAPAPRVAMVWITLPSERAATDLTRTLRTAARDARRHGAARGVDVAAIEHLDARSLAIVREDGAARRHQVAAPEAARAALLAQVELPADAASSAAAAYREIGNALADDAPDTPLVRLCRLLAGAASSIGPKSHCPATGGRRT